MKNGKIELDLVEGDRIAMAVSDGHSVVCTASLDEEQALVLAERLVTAVEDLREARARQAKGATQ
ncbi:hypothetical protein BA190_26785 [Labrys sp. WJW]|uniref:hypothetical protein n=1 Tax=Labrys sp. WJW TaxID=1737983 RepID=UPI00082CF967|nr:hypothetical protein [Labrys sp. WJW]OCC01821.1 hypothetical protein BA190_26785 [Labrys sp. WJW]